MTPKQLSEMIQNLNKLGNVLNIYGGIVNSVDHDQTAPNGQSDFGLYYLLNQVCISIYVLLGNFSVTLGQRRGR